MNNHVHELLSAFIDGELTEDERKKVAEHVANCPQCSKELKELQWLKQELFAAYHSIEIPDVQFEHSIMNKMEQLSSPNRFVRRIISVMVLLMAAVILFKMGTVLYVAIMLASSFMNIGLSLLHALASVLAAIPFLLIAFFFTSIVIWGISIWSIRYLLGFKSLD